MTHGGKRDGAGRKPKAPKQLRRHTVAIRLTDAEAAAVERVERARDVSARDVLLAGVEALTRSACRV